VPSLHSVADAPYDSLNVMKAVGRLIPKCRPDTYVTLRHGPLEGMSSGKGTVRTQYFPYSMYEMALRWASPGSWRWPPPIRLVEGSSRDRIGCRREGRAM
jgi:hypothetical protein